MLVTVNTQSPVEALLPYRPVPSLHQLEALRQQTEQSLEALRPQDQERRAWELGNLAGVAFALGDGMAAVINVQEAIRAAQESGQVTLRGYLLNTLGAALCYEGNYAEAIKAFEAAESIFFRTSDSLGSAWNHHMRAREYLRDARTFGDALRQLDLALPVLRSRGNPEVIIENYLTRVACLIQINDLRHARDLIYQVEGMIMESKCFWYRPEMYVLRAELSTRENDVRVAWQQCYTGLGSVSDHGDLRLLPLLYLTLATALEHDKTRLEDARDALERAINAGRARGRKLHLALALRKMGQHLKRFSVRPTVRARGSGFLFEASQLLREMNVQDAYPV